MSCIVGYEEQLVHVMYLGICAQSVRIMYYGEWGIICSCHILWDMRANHREASTEIYEAQLVHVKYCRI
jgi:hypothetical protein